MFGDHRGHNKTYSAKTDRATKKIQKQVAAVQSRERKRAEGAQTGCGSFQAGGATRRAALSFYNYQSGDHNHFLQSCEALCEVGLGSDQENPTFRHHHCPEVPGNLLSCGTECYLEKGCPVPRSYPACPQRFDHQADVLCSLCSPFGGRFCWEVDDTPLHRSVAGGYGRIPRQVNSILDDLRHSPAAWCLQPHAL